MKRAGENIQAHQMRDRKIEATEATIQTRRKKLAPRKLARLAMAPKSEEHYIKQQKSWEPFGDAPNKDVFTSQAAKDMRTQEKKIRAQDKKNPFENNKSSFGNQAAPKKFAAQPKKKSAQEKGKRKK
jgi:hypothetical protein